MFIPIMSFSYLIALSSTAWEWLKIVTVSGMTDFNGNELVFHIYT